MKTWHLNLDGTTLSGYGNDTLLRTPLTAFFSSRRCPGAAIRAAPDWALEQARNGQPVIGGFHAPLKQSVLALLLLARSPVVAVPARPVTDAHLPGGWIRALTAGHMAVLSYAPRAARLTSVLAFERNAHVGALARQIVIAHAEPGGQLARLCATWRDAQRDARYLTAQAQ